MSDDPSTRPEQLFKDTQVGASGSEMHFSEGAPLDSGSESFVNQVIDGKYRILERLGSGGMGAVYRGQHELMDRTVAIKLLHPHLVANPELLKRFQHEARVASKLNHPHAIQTYDYGIYNGAPYIVMEFAQGRTLKDLIQDEGPQPIGKLLRFFEQVGSALAKAHEIGIVHRDLKPENIMLVKQRDGSESATVLDFGIAKILQHQNDQNITAGMTRAGTFCGTPKYASPEQVLEKVLDHRADIYTLGIILYESLSGEVPFDAPSYMELLVKHVNQQPVSLRKFKPTLGIAPELDAAVMKCLNKAPEERYQTVIELIDALKAASQTAQETLPPMKQGSSMSTLGLVGGGVLLLGGTIFFIGQQLLKDPTTESEAIARNDLPTLSSPTPVATPEQRSSDHQGLLATELLTFPTTPIATPEIVLDPSPEPTVTELPTAESTPLSEVETSPNPTPDLSTPVERDVTPTPMPTESTEQPPAILGSLTINSNPPGAEIFLNGERRGVTPMTLNKLATGSYTIVLKNKDFVDYQSVMVIDSDEAKVVTGVLQRDVSVTIPDAGSKQVAMRLFKEGMALYKSKRYVDAAAKFEQAVKVRSDAVASLIGLGNCYLRLGRHSEAQVKFLAATRADATYGPAHYNLAAFYAVTGEKEKAIQSLRKAVALDGRARASARNEADFSSLKELPDFKEIVGR